MGYTVEKLMINCGDRVIGYTVEKRMINCGDGVHSGKAYDQLR